MCPLGQHEKTKERLRSSTGGELFCRNAKKKERKTTSAFQLIYTFIPAALSLSGQDQCVGLESIVQFMRDILLFTCLLCVCVLSLASCFAPCLSFTLSGWTCWLLIQKLVALFLFVWPTSWHFSLVCNMPACYLNDLLRCAGCLYWQRELTFGFCKLGDKRGPRGQARLEIRRVSRLCRQEFGLAQTGMANM